MRYNRFLLILLAILCVIAVGTLLAWLIVSDPVSSYRLLMATKLSMTIGIMTMLAAVWAAKSNDGQ